MKPFVKISERITFDTTGPRTPLPEPSSIILLGSVLVGVVTLLKRKTHGRTFQGPFDFSADSSHWGPAGC
jgi:hypothetical protein